MKLRKLFFAATVVIIVAALAPLGSVFADSLPEDCADGVWEVRAGQTLYGISFTCGTTVEEIVALNGISNPNLIYPGQVLNLPGGSTTTPTDGTDTTGNTPDDTTDDSPPPPSNGAAGVAVDWGSPLYAGDGKVVDIPVTVHNISVLPGIAGGRHPIGYGEDHPEGPRWVTLIGAVHSTIPYPQVTDEPLWEATVYTNDGLSFPAYVGCKYVETVYAQGDEPISRADNIWFHWEVELPGGWFDCGNQYQVKPPDLLPGQSGSSILTVYLVHPRENVMSVSRRVTRVDLALTRTDGVKMGIVSTQTFQ